MFVISSLTFFFFFNFLGQALSKALTEDELIYLRLQFDFLEPNKDGRVSLENFRMVSLLPFIIIILCFSFSTLKFFLMGKKG